MTDREAESVDCSHREPNSERRPGHSRLVYNKTTRTIDTVPTSPSPDAALREALAALLPFAEDPNLIACTTYRGYTRRDDAIKKATALLSAHPPPDSRWNEAIEEAAKVADSYAQKTPDRSLRIGAKWISDDIRSLKSPAVRGEGQS